MAGYGVLAFPHVALTDLRVVVSALPAAGGVDAVVATYKDPSEERLRIQYAGEQRRP